jgi:glycerophosphoryl diester phosphodiesterase
VKLPEVLYTRPIAHRGLWTAGAAPENSLAAFEAAWRAGYGIELDVRLSADGQVMVFHDETLERMTGLAGTVETLTLRQLQEVTLAGTSQPIPTLAQVLELVAGQAMLLVEIKSGPAGAGALVARTADLLERYQGPAAAISFDALALAWLAEHRPAIARGLDFMRLEEPAMAEHFERADELAGPHFLVLELKSAPAAAAQRRRAHGLPVIAWTARSKEDASRLGGSADNIIFEGFAA